MIKIIGDLGGTMKYKSGEEFLNKLYSEMYKEYTVSHSASKNATTTGKISGYLKRLDDVHGSVKDNEHKLNLLKQFYYEKYVIKELPDNYIAFRQRIARERGFGALKMNKEEMLKRVQEGQKKSLDKWIDYLIGDETNYPIWFKNYVFRGMLKLSRFDKDTLSFGKRAKTTTEPYIELDKEVLGSVYEALKNEIGSNHLTELQEEAIQNGESFGKLYAFYIKKNHNRERVGIWVRYKKNSDYHKLEDDLQGKNTGWCTADEMSAKEQLMAGDFYVYYTKDKNGEYKVPRIAISMEDNIIVEVRGIKSDQGLEDEMIPIVSNKLSEFPDKNRYLKRAFDMKKMTVIAEKQRNGENLTRTELKFLYEFEKPIQGFGMERDPRIKEVKEKRNILEDYAKIFDVRISQVSFVKSLEELESCTSKNIIYMGDLELNKDNYEELKQKEKLKNIIVVTGDMKCASLKEVTAFEKLKSIGGSAHFDLVEDGKIPNNLQYVIKNIYFEHLKKADGLNVLNVGGHACFDSLMDATGLKLQNVEGNLYCDSLVDSRGFQSLQNVGGDLYVPHLQNFTGFSSLLSIGSIRQPINDVEMTPRDFMKKVKDGIREKDLSKMMESVSFSDSYKKSSNK